MHSLPQHFGIHSFQIDFRILHNLRGVFRTISNIYDAETPHYWQVRFCCLVFIIFLVWILEWVYEHLVFLLKVCSYFAHLTQIKNILRYSIGSQTTWSILKYHGITKYLYIYAIEVRLTLKNFKMECKADIYY